MNHGGGAGQPRLARTLVGRDAELAALQDAWRSGGTVRLVRGGPGIGKSRLVRELASWAVGRGGTVLTGRCTATSVDTPLRPLREALLGAARTGLQPAAGVAAFVPTLARLVPEWAPGRDAAPEPSPDSHLVLGEAILRLLAAAGTSTATLVVDDLQWADRETLAVLEYLADNVTGLPVLVIATLRDGEPGAGTDVAAALVARRAAAELQLGPLPPGDVLAVARSCLGGEDLPSDVAATLVERSEGVPFLVEELLAAAAGSGWAAVAAAVPGSVVSSVELRLSALPAPAGRLLHAAAVIGRQFDWTIAARAAGLDDATAADLLRQAARAQLVDVEGAGFRFRHALTRDAVLAATGPAERAVLARAALAALEAADPDLGGERLQAAAALAEQAGDRQRAGELLLEAARRAMAEGSLASAGALAAAAGDALAGTPAEHDVDLLQLRVAALAGQPERAVAIGERLLRDLADPHERADVHLLLGGAMLAAGRWDDADAHAGAARDLTGERSRLARAASIAAQAAMSRDDVDAATALAGEALAAARDSDLPEIQCEALEVIGRAQRGRDVDAAEAAFTEAHAIATAAGLHLWRVRALQELGTIDMFRSLSPDHLDEARRAAVALGALATAAVVDLQLAALHNERGDLDVALAAARRCEEASRRWGLATLPMSLSIQAMVHARAGRRAEMQAAVDAAYATGEDVHNVEISAWSNALPICDLVEGDLPAAAAAFDRAMAALRQRPGAAFPFPGLWALVRTLLDADDGGARARAEVAALRFDTPVSREMLLAAEAVAAGRAGDAAGAAARFAKSDDLLDRHQGGFRRSFVRLLVAPAALADGWGDPVSWLRESLAVFELKGLDALASRCRAALRDADVPVPRRGRGEAEAVPPALAALGITRREVDVLALVADGHTNREVAERLVISPRTVDKHVERLLLKTGARTRADLAAVARDAGLLRT